MPSFSWDTRLLGLIIDPVTNAKAPLLVNGLLAERGKLGAYVLVPLATPKPALPPLIAALRGLDNFCGAIVSVPHKAAVVPLLDSISAEAELTGAVNVIRRDEQGRLTGTCLDGEGLVVGLRARGHAVDGKSCLLLGAGGAASAIAMALARHGCAALTIENRTLHRAEVLAAAVSAAFPACVVRAGQDATGTFDLVINATTLGMKVDDPPPIDLVRLEGAGLVVECVVAQDTTPLLRAAQRMGRPTHPGLPMLQAQIELMLGFMGVPV